MLTLQALKEMRPHEIIATGTVENSPEGVFMTREHPKRMLIWVAKRGEIHDWAIYRETAIKEAEWIVRERTYDEVHEAVKKALSYLKKKGITLPQS